MGQSMGQSVDGVDDQLAVFEERRVGTTRAVANEVVTELECVRTGRKIDVDQLFRVVKRATGRGIQQRTGAAGVVRLAPKSGVHKKRNLREGFKNAALGNNPRSVGPR